MTTSKLLKCFVGVTSEAETSQSSTICRLRIPLLGLPLLHFVPPSFWLCQAPPTLQLHLQSQPAAIPWPSESSVSPWFCVCSALSRPPSPASSQKLNTWFHLPGLHHGYSRMCLTCPSKWSCRLFDRPLVAGCSTSHKPRPLHVNKWDFKKWITLPIQFSEIWFWSFKVVVITLIYVQLFTFVISLILASNLMLYKRGVSLWLIGSVGVWAGVWFRGSTSWHYCTDSGY